jgi:peptidoglycan/LPS O-acetylase OafA/YrhL
MGGKERTPERVLLCLASHQRGSRPHWKTPPMTTISARSILESVSGERVLGLDAIRAMAVSMVILGHATELRLPLLSGLSSLGVTTFFVLSGFLITRLLLDEAASSARIGLVAFYGRRVARLLPALVLYLLIAILIQAVQGRPVPWIPVLSTVFYVINYYQAFTGAVTSIVSHCWSLAVEEQFYLIWPVALVILLRKGTNLAWVLVAAVLSIWLWRWYLSLQASPPIDYLYRALDTRGDALAVGCLLAVHLRSSAWRERMARFLGSSPLVPPLIVVAILALNYVEKLGPAAKYGFCFVLEPPLIALAMLHAVHVAHSRSGALASALNNFVLVQIGRVSYGMYLFHGLVGYTAARIVEARTGSFWLGFAVAYLAIFVFSGLSFRLVETPARRWITAITSSARPH